MKVSQWIDNHPALPVTVAPEAEFEQIIGALLAETCLRDVYVVDTSGYVLGHLAHGKLAHMVLAEHRPVHSRRQIMERVAGGDARELMTAHCVHARPDEELDDVLHRQLAHNIVDMPVIDEDGKLVGVINLTQVLRAFFGP